jgi:hypothetical protein
MASFLEQAPNRPIEVDRRQGRPHSLGHRQKHRIERIRLTSISAEIEEIHRRYIVGDFGFDGALPTSLSSSQFE